MLRSRYTGSIYIAINVHNGRAYIGKTIMSLSRRRTTHHMTARVGKGSAFHAALRKYGAHSFRWRKLYESDHEPSLFDAEIGLIADFRAAGLRLYNVGPGGEGQSFPCSEERRRKTSATMRGKRKSEEARRRMSESAKGRKKSPEHVAKMRANQLGKTMPQWTPERRARMEAFWARGITRSPEQRENMRQAALRRFQRPGERDKAARAGRIGAEKRWKR